MGCVILCITHFNIKAQNRAWKQGYYLWRNPKVHNIVMIDTTIKHVRKGGFY